MSPTYEDVSVLRQCERATESTIGGSYDVDDLGEERTGFVGMRVDVHLVENIRATGGPQTVTRHTVVHTKIRVGRHSRESIIDLSR